MTVHYLSGEFSGLLQDLARLTTSPQDAGRVTELRALVERSAPQDLVALVPQVFNVIDAMCWASFADGDVAQVERRAALAHTLLEFAVAADLVPANLWRVGQGAAQGW